MDYVMDIEQIQMLLPHRFPFLLVDRIRELEPGVRIIGIKNVTINEPFFVGHFPRQAIMPGVLIVESMAQMAGVMICILPQNREKLAYLASIDSARFRKPVVPGDTLVIEGHTLKLRGTVGKARFVARVEDEIVAECEMTFALKDYKQITLREGNSE